MTDMNRALESLLTTREVLALVEERFDGRKVTERQLTTAVQNDRLHPTLVSRVRLFDRQEVEAWMSTLRPSRTNDSALRTKSHSELARESEEGDEPQEADEES